MAKKIVKHYTASSLIFSDSAPAKTLLVHHKKFDLWLMPGGHQLSSENPLEAAIREVREETGIDITSFMPTVSSMDEISALVPRPKYIVEVNIPAHGKEEAHYHIDMMYVARIPEQSVKHRPSESHGIKWYEQGELEALAMPSNVRQLIFQEMNQQ